MAVAVSDLNRIEQIMIKVGENGYMVQFEGETENKDWYNIPLVASDIEGLVTIIREKLELVGNTPK